MEGSRSAFAMLLPLAYTVTPLSESAVATPRPTPRLAPVMTATWVVIVLVKFPRAEGPEKQSVSTFATYPLATASIGSVPLRILQILQQEQFTVHLSTKERTS